MPKPETTTYALFKEGKQVSKAHSTRDAVIVEAERTAPSTGECASWSGARGSPWLLPASPLPRWPGQRCFRQWRLLLNERSSDDRTES
jgi:hypothetical protein